MGAYGTKPTIEKYGPVIHEENKVCCIIINNLDRLRLLACPPEVIQPVRECIISTWGTIQHEVPYFGSHEFKLKDYPWSRDRPVSSRRLITGLLTVMARQGWNLIQSTEVNSKRMDMDTLFFEKGNEDVEAILFSVSFIGLDRILIIDAPQFVPTLKQAVIAFWPRGIQSEWEYDRSLELKLKGNPWYSKKQNAVHTKLVLAQILANFRSLGYKLYASTYIGIHKQGRDLDCWVFRKVGENWK